MAEPGGGPKGRRALLDSWTEREPPYPLAPPSPPPVARATSARSLLATAAAKAAPPPWAGPYAPLPWEIEQRDKPRATPAAAPFLPRGAPVALWSGVGPRPASPYSTVRRLSSGGRHTQKDGTVPAAVRATSTPGLDGIVLGVAGVGLGGGWKGGGEESGAAVRRRGVMQATASVQEPLGRRMAW